MRKIIFFQLLILYAIKTEAEEKEYYCKSSTCGEIQNRLTDLEKKYEEVREYMKDSKGCLIALESLGHEDPGSLKGIGYIKVSGKYLNLGKFTKVPSQSTNFRGLHVATLGDTRQGCPLLHAAKYDTYAYSTAAVALDHYLRSLKPGRLVVGICFDECVYQIAPALNTLRSMGIYIQNSSAYTRSSIAFIAWKDQPQRGLLVQPERKKGPALLKYTVHN